MRLFQKKPVQTRVNESTLDLRRQVATQTGKLRRAEELKKRSSDVAADLSLENKTNGYAKRLRIAYGLE